MWVDVGALPRYRASRYPVMMRVRWIFQPTACAPAEAVLSDEVPDLALECASDLRWMSRCPSRRRGRIPSQPRLVTGDAGAGAAEAAMLLASIADWTSHQLAARLAEDHAPMIQRTSLAVGAPDGVEDPIRCLHRLRRQLGTSRGAPFGGNECTRERPSNVCTDGSVLGDHDRTRCEVSCTRR